MIAWAFLIAAVPYQPPVAAPDNGPPAVVAKSEDFPDALQWDVLAASPRLTGVGGESGTAAVVGIRDGSMYVLSANHVVPGNGEYQLEFFTRETYRRPEKLKERVFTGVEVALRISKADVVLLKVSLGSKPAPNVLKVPKPWDRPKQFPATALSVGCDDGNPPTCRVEQIRAKQLVRRPTDTGTFFCWNTVAAPVQGRSGGPLIDKRGRLIGVCAAAKGSGGYYTHLDEIHAALKQDGYAWIWESVGGR